MPLLEMAKSVYPISCMIKVCSSSASKKNTDRLESIGLSYTMYPQEPINLAHPTHTHSPINQDNTS